MASKPAVITEYNESDFKRPRMIVGGQCPICGQAWRINENKRMCDYCGKLKYHKEFTQFTGMCDSCYNKLKEKKKQVKEKKKYRNKVKEKKYNHEYYLTVTKPKRDAARAAKKEAEQRQCQLELLTSNDPLTLAGNE